MKENESFHVEQQVSWAKQAQELLRSVGFPSVHDLKTAIKMNAIANCPVTTQDVDLAEKIFGRDIDSLKDKTIHQEPTPIVQDIVGWKEAPQGCQFPCPSRARWSLKRN